MKKVNEYSDAFKQGVVKEVTLGQISKEGARRKYGIGGSTTIGKWIRKYESSMPKELFKEAQEQKSIESLELEIKQLKHQLAFEQLRSEAFETMIVIAEEAFKIPIRKKSGAKPPKQ